MAEVIVKGRKYRILVDSVERLWNRLSFWTAASDVEFESGDTLEANIGSIKGITSSTAVTEAGYAADATAVSAINNNMQYSFGGLRFGQKDGEYGFFTGEGADTFRPFKDPKYYSSVFITTSTFNMADVYSKYYELTTSNFHPVLSSANAWFDICGSWSDGSKTFSTSYSYNPSTGIFTGGLSASVHMGAYCGGAGGSVSLSGYIAMW